MSDALAPVSAIHARARPGVVLGVYGAHLLIASVIAVPFAAVVSQRTAAEPTGDLLLFEPGGLFLLELLRLSEKAFGALLQSGLWVAFVAGYLGLLPLAALLYALSRRGRLSVPELAAASVRPLGALSLLLGMALVAYAVVLTLAVTVSSLLGLRLHDALGDRGGDIAQASIVLAGLLFAAALGVVHDLARASAVVRGERALDAVRAGFATFGPRALFAWGWRILASATLVGVGMLFAGRVGVATPRATFVVLCAHQLVALGLVALRASWLAAALRLVVRA